MPIVNLARPIDAQADQESVLLEERAPFLGDQGPVGLQVVLDLLTGLCVLPLEAHHLAVEVEAEPRRFPALPRKDDFRTGDGGDVLLDEALQHLVGHDARARSAWKRLLAQVIAVVALQVAGRAAWLDHHVKAPSRRIRHQRGGVVFVHLATSVSSLERVTRVFTSHSNETSTRTRDRTASRRTAPR